MTQAHVKFPENVVRPPDDYSDLEESYALQLTQDVLQHEVRSADHICLITARQLSASR